jgi:hypothetical protein
VLNVIPQVGTMNFAKYFKWARLYLQLHLL